LANFILNNKSNNILVLPYYYIYILLAANTSANKRPAMDWTAGVRMPVETLGVFLLVAVRRPSYQLSTGYQRFFPWSVETPGAWD
jgi:hypothetical protein